MSTTTKCRLLQNVVSYKMLDYDGLGQVKTISGTSAANEKSARRNWGCIQNKQTVDIVD